MLGLFLPNHLQWIQIPVHSREDCESIFPGYITDNMVCAGSAGAATCNGDSGGPLVCPDESGNGNKVLHCHKEYLLTLIGRGFWMLLESGGGLNQPAPSRSPQNTVKNQKIFF